jgi:hypothetical protein
LPRVQLQRLVQYRVRVCDEAGLCRTFRHGLQIAPGALGQLRTCIGCSLDDLASSGERRVGFFESARLQQDAQQLDVCARLPGEALDHVTDEGVAIFRARQTERVIVEELRGRPDGDVPVRVPAQVERAREVGERELEVLPSALEACRGPRGDQVPAQ